jgi:polysaccharide pyruvyl transferase WcaK-like protein
MKKAVILNDTSYESHHGCETVVKNIKELLLKNGIETIDTNPVGKNWLENKNFLQNMSKVDIVIVNGEGTLHHAQPRAKELITIGKYIKENINIPVVLINATYQANGDDLAEYMKYFDLVFVRETLSKTELEKYDIKSIVVPDMTFYSRFDLSQKNSSTYIGVTDSVYIELSQTLYTLSLEEKYKYLPALTNPKFKIDSVRNFLRLMKFNLFKSMKFILFKFGFSLSHQAIRMFYYINDYKNYIQKIANLNFLIVGRYHSLCFALKTLTPFVALKSNSHKIEGMLEDIGMGQNRIIEENDIVKIKMKSFSDSEQTKILDYINTAPIKIENMFKEIKKLLEK